MRSRSPGTAVVGEEPLPPPDPPKMTRVFGRQKASGRGTAWARNCMGAEPHRRAHRGPPCGWPPDGGSALACGRSTARPRADAAARMRDAALPVDALAGGQPTTVGAVEPVRDGRGASPPSAGRARVLVLSSGKPPDARPGTGWQRRGAATSSTACRGATAERSPKLATPSATRCGSLTTMLVPSGGVSDVPPCDLRPRTPCGCGPGADTGVGGDASSRAALLGAGRRGGPA